MSLNLFRRQAALSAFGLLNLALFGIFVVLAFFDARMFEGVNVWIKPAKFALSIGVFILTQAFFFGYVKPERRGRWHLQFVVWGGIVAAGFELGYIAFQASRGEASHFNLTSGFTIAMYALMGVGAVVLLSTVLPLAYEIGRYGIAELTPLYRFGVASGLVVTWVATMIVAGYMSQNMSHYIGPAGGHFPLFGWNRAGGDLRVSHLFSLHAEQAYPIAAAVLQALPRSIGWLAFIAFALAYLGLVAFTFLEALQGRAFLAGWGGWFVTGG
jgi:hypothetical protein